MVTLLNWAIQAYLGRADRIVAIGETMRKRLEQKGVEPERLSVIPNWVDTSRIVPVERRNAWARAHGLDDKFVVMHSGNVGHAQSLETLVRAATFLRDLDDLAIVIIGTGARRRELERLAEVLEADNVRMLDFQPEELLGQSLSTADVHYVGLSSRLSGFIVPSRLYGILAAGRPVLAAVDDDSETADIVRRAGCGVVLAPDRSDLLAAAIRAAHAGEFDLEGMGVLAREHAVAEANRESRCPATASFSSTLSRAERTPEACRARRRGARIVAVVLVLIGRQERVHEETSMLRGIARVRAAIPNLVRPGATDYLQEDGLDCLLYAVGTRPYALELCIDGKGRVVEAIDRRGLTPSFYTVVLDPGLADLLSRGRWFSHRSRSSSDGLIKRQRPLDHPADRKALSDPGVAGRSQARELPAFVRELVERTRERAGSPDGTSMPVTPSITASGVPPTAVATTGRACAMASSTTSGRPSAKDGRTSASARVSREARSSRRPRKRTRPARPSSSARRSR